MAINVDARTSFVVGPEFTDKNKTFQSIRNLKCWPNLALNGLDRDGLESAEPGPGPTSQLEHPLSVRLEYF